MAQDLRGIIRDTHHMSETAVLERLMASDAPGPDLRGRASTRAETLVRRLRNSSKPALMEAFLAEYGLSTDEGIALMCLAEALLRVPDPETIDALIEDKIAPSAWGEHAGRSNSAFVNASTWALMLTGRVLEDGTGVAHRLRSLVKRLGEPVIRTAVSRAMRELGSQFVLGENIDAAMKRGAAQVAKGYSYSFDMLGEAALTAGDADRYFDAYAHAISRIGADARGDIRDNPGISVKISALHPRYEAVQSARVMEEVVPRLRDLARRAARAGIGLNVDAEEADRLDISLDVIEAVLKDRALADWEGFGVVVQAYGKRAGPVIDWLADRAGSLNRRLMVRLVKGAYWDTEVKRAQVEGLADFPVFTRKAHTDVSYLCCASRLLDARDRLYPQFATHNAHTLAMIAEMAGNADRDAFEFQRLHGMGESLHEEVRRETGRRCRIYAPVGTHRDLLAYLVRRLLENGANSSFVNQIVDTSVPASDVAADPFDRVDGVNPAIPAPRALFAPERPNSNGWDLADPVELERFEAARAPFRTATWAARSLVAGAAPEGAQTEIRNPAVPDDLVGHAEDAGAELIETALADFPVFTRKAHTDVSYLCCASRLLDARDRLYPQFATHNAHTLAMIAEMAGNADRDAFEFQRLHGMGESLHEEVRRETGRRCRIYAPVGTHRDLLAYLVRRLLENGANSSFVNQIVDTSVPASDVAADPFDRVDGVNPAIPAPRALFAPERPNSNGWDLADPVELERFEAARAPFRTATWTARSLVAGAAPEGTQTEIRNPAVPDDLVGHAEDAGAELIETALARGKPWSADAETRKAALRAAADAFETASGELCAILAREAGKTPFDAIAEIREAVDFLRYYSGFAADNVAPRGVFACIAPWNFPLAIFTGQIAAALSAGNGVIAKPAEPTPLVAFRAVEMLHAAGVPAASLQLLIGPGSTVGAALSSDPRIAGVCFTGSTATAQKINRAMAAHLPPDAPLIAETGGINAMIVDSTALPEQAVRDIVASAFQSAGQRCSALRVLYLQRDIAERFKTMLFGAMDELSIGDPWPVSADVGPVITDEAQADIGGYIADAKARKAVLKTTHAPAGRFIPPTVIEVTGMKDVPREVFGPVLHLATFEADEIDAVCAEINQSGYGLTFGLHTRIDERVETVSNALAVGNIYVNRNQIGAVVGSQPFGGEGLSGTGPKAGGPAYVARFTDAERVASAGDPATARIDPGRVQAAIDAAAPSGGPIETRILPGPTGELNRLSVHGRGVVLCLGPSREDAQVQIAAAEAQGCAAVAIAPGQTLNGVLDPSALEKLAGIDAVVSFAGEDDLAAQRRALAARSGAIIPLLCETDFAQWCRLERHLCVDTTAAGGNASLLAASE